MDRISDHRKSRGNRNYGTVQTVSGFRKTLRKIFVGKAILNVLEVRGIDVTESGT